LHLNIGLSLNIQKDGTADGDNGRVTVEGSFAMAMTLGLPGTFVGSFVGQGYLRISGNPPSIKSDGTSAFAGQSTIAQAKWLVTEWLGLMVKDTRVYKFYAKFADKKQKANRAAMIKKLVKTVTDIRKAVIHEETDEGEEPSSDGPDPEMSEALTDKPDPKALEKAYADLTKLQKEKTEQLKLVKDSKANLLKEQERAKKQKLDCLHAAQQGQPAGPDCDKSHFEKSANLTQFEKEEDEAADELKTIRRKIEQAENNVKIAGVSPTEGRLTNAASWLHMHFVRELSKLCIAAFNYKNDPEKYPHGRHPPDNERDWTNDFVSKAWYKVYMGAQLKYIVPPSRMYGGKPFGLKCKPCDHSKGLCKYKITKQFVKLYAPKEEQNCNHKLDHYLEKGMGECMEAKAGSPADPKAPAEGESDEVDVAAPPKVPNDQSIVATQSLVCGWMSAGALLGKSQGSKVKNVKTMLKLAYPEFYGEKHLSVYLTLAKMYDGDYETAPPSTVKCADHNKLNIYFADVNVESMQIYANAYTTLFKDPKLIESQLGSIEEERLHLIEAAQSKQPCAMTAEMQFDTTATVGPDTIGFCSGQDTNPFQYVRSRKWTWDSGGTGKECSLGKMTKQDITATMILQLGGFIGIDFIQTLGKPAETTVGFNIWLQNDGPGAIVGAAFASMMGNVPAKFCRMPGVAKILKTIFRKLLTSTGLARGAKNSKAISAEESQEKLLKAQTEMEKEYLKLSSKDQAAVSDLKREIGAKKSAEGDNLKKAQKALKKIKDKWCYGKTGCKKTRSENADEKQEEIEAIEAKIKEYGSSYIKSDPPNAALTDYRKYEKKVYDAKFEVNHPGETPGSGVAAAAGAAAAGAVAVAAGAGALAGIGSSMVTAMAFAKNFVSNAIPELIKSVLKMLGNTPIGKSILGALNPLKKFMASLGKKAAKAVFDALGMPSLEFTLMKQTQIGYKLNPKNALTGEPNIEGDELSFTDNALIGASVKGPDLGMAPQVGVQSYVTFGQSATCGDDALPSKTHVCGCSDLFPPSKSGDFCEGSTDKKHFNHRAAECAQHLTEKECKKHKTKQTQKQIQANEEGDSFCGWNKFEMGLDELAVKQIEKEQQEGEDRTDLQKASETKHTNSDAHQKH